MSIDTGFDLHVAIPVDRNGVKPNASKIAAAKNNIVHVAKGKARTPVKFKWFDVTGLGYDKDWMFVMGCNYRG